MNLYHKIILFAALALSACTEPIELDLNNQEFQRLVVDGLLTNETKAHKVSLSLTTDYFVNEAPPKVEGATVTISDGTNTYPLTEQSPGDYFTADDMTGEIGKTYTLTIEWKGQTYKATSPLKDVAPIDYLEAEVDTGPEVEEIDNKTDYIILLYTTEPAGEGDNYYWKSYPVDEPDNIERTYWEIATDEFVDGNPIEGAEILYIFAEPGEQFVVEQYGLNRDAYDFYLSIQFETDFKGGIFDAPPANIVGNLDNGALGFFLTAAVARDTVLIE